jgi:hypothetical protein
MKTKSNTQNQLTEPNSLENPNKSLGIKREDNSQEHVWCADQDQVLKKLYSQRQSYVKIIARFNSKFPRTKVTPLQCKQRLQQLGVFGHCRSTSNKPLKKTLTNIVAQLMGDQVMCTQDIIDKMRGENISINSKTAKQYISQILYMGLLRGLFKRVKRGYYCVSNPSLYLKLNEPNCLEQIKKSSGKKVEKVSCSIPDVGSISIVLDGAFSTNQMKNRVQHFLTSLVNYS